MKNAIWIITVLFLILIPWKLFGDDHIRVCVSIPPQRFFLEKIGGNKVDISVVLPPGLNPATYEPKPSSMKSITRAKAYISTGVPFERIWLGRFKNMNPRMMISYAGRGIELIPMNGNDISHKHILRYDPHIWLSPPLVMLQARNILDTLITIDPVNATYYIGNYKEFIDEIASIDSKIIELLLNKRGRAFVVYHPSWGYFAKAYGLKQIPVEVEGKEPSPKELTEIIKRCRYYHVKAIYYQPQFPKKGIKTIAKETGLKLIPADPLSEEWDKNILDFAISLRKTLE